MFYDGFLYWCEVKGISPTRALLNLGYSKSMLTNWKNGSDPLNETKKKIADYFGITVQQLMQGEKGNAPIQKNEGVIKPDMIDLNKEDKNIRILHRAAVKMTPENRQKLIDMARLMFDEEFKDE